MTNKLLKAHDLAEILGISRSQAYSLMRDGSIEIIRFGRSVRVTEEALIRFIMEATAKTKRVNIKTKLSVAAESKAQISANATN